MSEGRVWTGRKPITDVDARVIRSIVDNNRVAARIFVTGEVHNSYIGEAATRLLANINEVFYAQDVGLDPLFIETRADTIRMLRFDPYPVWSCIHPDIIRQLFTAEAARLGVDMNPWALEHMDFYQSLIDYMQKKVGSAVPVVKHPSTLDDFYHAVYLSCLLLFGKPGYMAVPVTEHFALPKAAAFVKAAQFQELTCSEQKELAGLVEKYRDIQALTNPEMHFIVKLYEKRHNV